MSDGELFPRRSCGAETVGSDIVVSLLLVQCSAPASSSTPRRQGSHEALQPLCRVVRHGVGRADLPSRSRTRHSALHLREGSRVLDIGCGTGLNFPLLLAAVGRSGQVVGVDRSREMLEVARRKTIHAPPGNVALVEADAEQLDRGAVGPDGLGRAVRRGALHLLAVADERLGGTRGDTPLPWSAPVVARGSSTWSRPTAGPGCSIRLLGWPACSAEPISTHVPGPCSSEQQHDVQSWSLRGGHVQVRVGTL